MISYEGVETDFDGFDYMVAQSRWTAPTKAQGELLPKPSVPTDKKPPGAMLAKASKSQADIRLPMPATRKKW